MWDGNYLKKDAEKKALKTNALRLVLSVAFEK